MWKNVSMQGNNSHPQTLNAHWVKYTLHGYSCKNQRNEATWLSFINPMAYGEEVYEGKKSCRWPASSMSMLNNAWETT
jgi:hypothetical protein